MKINNHSLTQLARIHAWHSFVDNLPKLGAPLPLLRLMDWLLPTSCAFNKAIWFRGKLVYYVPVLCQLNPFYDALADYRLEKYLSENIDITERFDIIDIETRD